MLRTVALNSFLLGGTGPMERLSCSGESFFEQDGLLSKNDVVCSVILLKFSRLNDAFAAIEVQLF
jgi:hypothetical protein